MVIIPEQAEIQVTKMLSRLKPELFANEWADYGKPTEYGYEGTEAALDHILEKG